MSNQIEAALAEYTQEQKDKRGVLLTPEGGYYLYGNQFCPIAEFDLTLAAEGLYLQSASVQLGIFFGLTHGELRWCVKEEAALTVHRMSLIFHISFGAEAELLRGILFIQNGSAYLSLFTDPETEQLYRAVSASAPRAAPQESGECVEILALAKEREQDSLHILTELYLHGQRLGQKGIPF